MVFVALEAAEFSSLAKEQLILYFIKKISKSHIFGDASFFMK